jgi:hypothetical protein
MVPGTLVIDELQRWPWQKVSGQWGEIGAGQNGSTRRDASDIRRDRGTPSRLEQKGQKPPAATGTGGLDGAPWILF